MTPLSIACLIPPHYDYLCATLIEGLSALGHECKGLHSSNYCQRLSFPEFQRYVGHCDIAIVFAGNLVDTRLVQNIRNAKIAFVDGTDLPDLAPMPISSVHHIFKRELIRRLATELDGVISPLPFGIERRYIQDSGQQSRRDIDVSFVGSMSNFLRSSVHCLLQTLRQDGVFSGGTKEAAYDGLAGTPHSTPKYYDILGRSVASIDVPGRGWDCGRTWEIVGANAALVKFRSEILMPHPFEEKEHYIGFSTLEELEVLIRSVPSMRGELRQMAQRCKEFSYEFHTSLRRAEYFVKILESSLTPHAPRSDLIRFSKPQGVRLRTMAYRSLRWGYNNIRSRLPSAN